MNTVRLLAAVAAVFSAEAADAGIRHVCVNGSCHVIETDMQSYSAPLPGDRGMKNSIQRYDRLQENIYLKDSRSFKYGRDLRD